MNDEENLVNYKLIIENTNKLKRNDKASTY